MKTRIKPKGFTLIEILCVLLIISVLALIAYPSYMNYIYKANRLDAANSLYHFQALWQKCLLNTPDAQACLESIGLSSSQTQTSLSAHYQISANVDETTVIFFAKPILSQSKDSTCAEFILDSLGQMKAYDQHQQDTTVQCW
ncbi:MAG: type IV pilin protein [Gammaproteobacteria bacterium]|jgi:type IV pilus assembly protein PilE